MLKLLSFFVVFLTAAGACIPAASAQDENAQQPVQEEGREFRLQGANDFNYIGGPYYNAMATDLFQNRPKRYDFTALRSYYAMTRQYDPIGEDTRKKILDLAYSLENETDREKLAKAAADYKKLVIDHLGNVGVVLQLQALARQNKRFGDPNFFGRVYSGLMYSVLHSGSGKNVEDAYDVMTMEEETALLGYLRVKVLESHAHHSGILYYNMHDVEDPQTGRKYTVFVNVTKPMEILEERRLEEEDFYKAIRR